MGAGGCLSVAGLEGENVPHRTRLGPISMLELHWPKTHLVEWWNTHLYSNRHSS